LLGLPIALPPLRDRGNDILILAKYFIQSFCTDNRMQLKSLSTEAQQKLKSYHYPGNVRELKSLMELATVMSDTLTIEAADINLETVNHFGNLLQKETTLREYETQIIQHFLNKYDQDVMLVSKKLDIGKSTIYRMLQNGEVAVR
ncbi:MAG: sigma-54-dependent Fis family transcriptional regulator, partial [Sediminibacterium sp.]